MKPLGLLALILAEIVGAVAISRGGVASTGSTFDTCNAVREGLQAHVQASLDIMQFQSGPGPQVSSAVTALREIQSMWTKGLPSPTGGSRPAFAFLETTAFVPSPSSECTAFVLADPEIGNSAVFIRQFVGGRLEEAMLSPGIQVKHPAV